MLEVMFLLSQVTWATDITGNASAQVQRREKKTERSLFFCLHRTALHVRAGSLRLYRNILYQNLYCYFLRENFKIAFTGTDEEGASSSKKAVRTISGTIPKLGT